MLRSGKLSEEVSMNVIKYKSEGEMFETRGNAWAVLLAFLVRILEQIQIFSICSLVLLACGYIGCELKCVFLCSSSADWCC